MKQSLWEQSTGGVSPLQCVEAHLVLVYGAVLCNISSVSCFWDNTHTHIHPAALFDCRNVFELLSLKSTKLGRILGVNQLREDDA